MTRRTPTSWRAVREALLARIRDGAWPPGTLIPGEVALAAEFGCARTTMNRALRDLAEAGLLERRRRAGTRVAETPVRHARLAIPIVRLEVEADGRAYSHSLLERRMRAPPPELARRLPPGAGRMLFLRTLHRADGAPHMYEERYVNPAAAPGALKADFGAVSANEWLVREAPFTRGAIVLSAAAATAAEATALAVEPGAPLFILDRTTWMGEAPITRARMCYPPGHRIETLI